MQKAPHARVALANWCYPRQEQKFEVLSRLPRHNDGLLAYFTNKLGFLLFRSVYRDKTAQFFYLKFHRVLSATLEGDREQDRGC